MNVGKVLLDRREERQVNSTFEIDEILMCLL